MSERRHKQLSWTAVLVSVLTGTGGTVKAYLDSRNTDQFRYVIAKEVAANEVRHENTQEDLAAVLQENKELRTALTDLRVSVELLTRGQRTVAREALPVALATPAPRIKKPPAKLEPEYIQQKQAELFSNGAAD